MISACACIHENFNLFISAIKPFCKSIISPNNFFKQICCNVSSEQCSYLQNCAQCCNIKDIVLSFVSHEDLEKNLTFSQWTTINGKCCKVSNNCSLHNFVDTMTAKIPSFKSMRLLHICKSTFLRKNVKFLPMTQ